MVDSMTMRSDNWHALNDRWHTYLICCRAPPHPLPPAQGVAFTWHKTWLTVWVITHFDWQVAYIPDMMLQTPPTPHPSSLPPPPSFPPPPPPVTHTCFQLKRKLFLPDVKPGWYMTVWLMTHFDWQVAYIITYLIWCCRPPLPTHPIPQPHTPLLPTEARAVVFTWHKTRLMVWVITHFD